MMLSGRVMPSLMVLAKTVGFGRNGGSLSINVADLVVPFMPVGFNTAQMMFCTACRSDSNYN